MKKIDISLENITEITNIQKQNIVGVLPTHIVDLVFNYDYPELGFNNQKDGDPTKQKNKETAITKIIEFLIYLSQRYKNKMDSLNIEAKKTKHLINISKSEWTLFFSKHMYLKIQEVLKNLNILEKPTKDGKEYNGYNVGKWSKVFMIKYNFTNPTFNYSIIINPNHNNNIKDSLEVDLSCLRHSLDKRFIDTIKTIKLLKNEAIEAELQEYYNNNINIFSLFHRLNSILLFGRKRFIKNGNKVDRVYHCITNLSSVTRKYLSIPMNMIDLKNSQPLILVYVMASKRIKYDILFKQHVQDGIFYEQFMHLNSNCRATTKVSIYRDVLFAFKEESKVNKHFKKIYPLVWNYLRIIDENKEVNGTLAHLLQNEETAIFGDIGKYLLDSENFFTLHDSVYYSGDDTLSILNALNRKFDTHGVKASFNIELITNK